MPPFPNEPPYPRDSQEMVTYCTRFVDALRTHLGNRLVCVLLFGSWARGEARPPESDVDLVVVVDTVDDTAIAALQRTWIESGNGTANIYGADEISATSREAPEMYTSNVRVLWGQNPFPPPRLADFADGLAVASENVGRSARSLLCYPWLPEEERDKHLDWALAKYGVPRALQYAAACHTGTFPRNAADLAAKLEGTPDGDLLRWLDGLDENDRRDQREIIARRLNTATREWFALVKRIQHPSTAG